MQTLVIDTSYGSTVGVVGHEPIVETDSRTHVEKLQVNIAQAVEQAGLQASDITRIVVGVGPAPFTGLRAGIVAAKALAFATGAQLVGQDVLAPQCLAHTQATDDRRHLTLAVNDARRRQLYFALYDGGTVADGVGQSPITLIDMDIDYPDSITMRVNDVLMKLAGQAVRRRRHRPWCGQIRAVVECDCLPRRSRRPCSARRRRGRIGAIRGLHHQRTGVGRTDPRRTVISASSGRVSAQPAQACAQPCRRRTNGVTARP